MFGGKRYNSFFVMSISRADNETFALLGGEAMGEIRVYKTLRQNGIQNSSVCEVFFVSLPAHSSHSSLSSSEASVQGGKEKGEVGELLGARGEFCFQETALLVLPRRGVVSPWSSKAGDIARRCGVTVNRVERGLLIQLPRDVASDKLRSVVPQIYDPMTQRALLNPNEWRSVFDEEESPPARNVSMGEDPVVALRNANRARGLALSEQDVARLAEYFAKRDPAEAELLFFAQAEFGALSA